MMQVNVTSSCSRTAISIGLDSTVGGTEGSLEESNFSFQIALEATELTLNI